MSKLRIIVISRHLHPQLAGEKVCFKEFDMKDAVEAEKHYWEKRAECERNYCSVEIFIAEEE